MVCSKCGGAMRQFQRSLRVPVVRCVECGHSSIGIAASGDKQLGCEAAVTPGACGDSAQGITEIMNRARKDPNVVALLLQTLGV